jgi:hypothetical protein
LGFDFAHFAVSLSMNPYAIPSIVSFLPFLFLGLAAVLQNRHEKSNLLLSAACIANALFVAVVASHATWALINNEIPCEDVGTIEVKGFHYPVQTYRVLQDLSQEEEVKRGKRQVAHDDGQGTSDEGQSKVNVKI